VSSKKFLRYTYLPLICETTDRIQHSLWGAIPCTDNSEISHAEANLGSVLLAKFRKNCSRDSTAILKRLMMCFRQRNCWFKGWNSGIEKRHRR